MGGGRGPNYGLCHSCRKSGHWLGESPTKRRCTLCGLGYVRWLMAGESSTRCGKLFFNCSNMNCRYFTWDEGGSSHGSSGNVIGNEDANDELCQMLRTYVRIRNEEDVEISLLTIRKTKANDKKN